MAYKRLTTEEWAKVEKLAAAGRSNRSMATEFGVSEAAIRKRLAAVAPAKIEAAARNIVMAASSLVDLPPSGQVKAFALADVWQNISSNMAKSAELSSATSMTMAAIANYHARRLDEDDPDREIVKLIHGLTETANKASSNPIELMKVNKGAPEQEVGDVPKGLGHFYASE